MGAVETELTVGYLIKRVQQALRRNCDAALRPTGLSMAQYTALRYADRLSQAGAVASIGTVGDCRMTTPWPRP